ncbi:hypothetical protein D1872_187670 [compost metagenome]
MQEYHPLSFHRQADSEKVRLQSPALIFEYIHEHGEQDFLFENRQSFSSLAQQKQLLFLQDQDNSHQTHPFPGAAQA